MNAFEAIKKGFVLSKGLVPLMVILFAFNFITSLILLGVVGTTPTPEKITQLIGVIVVIFFVMMLLWILLEGGLFSSIISKIKTDDAAISSFPGNCLQFFLRLLALTCLSALVVISIWFIGAVLAGLLIGFGQGKNPFFTAIGVIIFLAASIVSFVASVSLLMGHYILVAENGKVISSLKKGFSIFKEYWGRVVLLFILLILIFFSISILVSIISFLFSKIVPAGLVLGILNITITSLVNSYAGVLASGSLASLILAMAAQSSQGQEVSQG